MEQCSPLKTQKKNVNKEKSDQVDPENWDVKKIKWINNIGPTYIYIYI